jgi:hypothetical protein
MPLAGFAEQKANGWPPGSMKSAYQMPQFSEGLLAFWGVGCSVLGVVDGLFHEALKLELLVRGCWFESGEDV